MEAAITLEHLVVRRGIRTVLHDISLTLPLGQVISIIGPNGCGKSTLLKSINCMLPLAGGNIFIGSKNVHTFSRKELSRQIAFLAQHHTVPEDMTVEELVRLGRFPYQHFYSRLTALDREYIDKAIHAVRLSAYVDRPVRQLSGGEQQRAWLAVLLAQRSPILLLDEPTTYLDIRHQLHMMTVLRHINEKLKLTIIIVLHDINQAFQYSDCVVLLEAGRVIQAGTPRAVITPANMQRVFGVAMEIVTLSNGKQAVVPTGVYEDHDVYHQRR